MIDSRSFTDTDVQKRKNDLAHIGVQVVRFVLLSPSHRPLSLDVVANLHKSNLLERLQERFGELHKLPDSNSLFVVGEDAARIYYRYSKVHDQGRTFFGLRQIDLRQLEGHNSFLCLQVDDGSAPVFVPYSDFEEIFHTAQPAADGQFKVQLISSSQSRELYIARQGRFNVDGFAGLDSLAQSLGTDRLRTHRPLSHCQVQTLLAGIGRRKGFDIWIPDNDVGRLDWTMTKAFTVCKELPSGFEEVSSIMREIDVIWLSRASNRVEALFEVEHSTPVYSGLLRFNDLLLTSPELSRFSIVSNDTRRSVFSRQVHRPTFRKSGLAEMVSFLEYRNVFDWHARLANELSENG